MPNINQLKRMDLINLVIQDLHELRNSCDSNTGYAVDKNIDFFEAAKHLWRYVPWLIREYPKIDKTKIKELADFHLRGGLWEENLLKNLVRLEKSRLIDLVGPLREELLKQLRKIAAHEQRPLIVANIGCGAMEIERQIIDRLKENSLPAPVVWIGIDNSQASLAMARENLDSYRNFFNVSHELTPELIQKLKQPSQSHTIQFILGDAISSLSRLSPGTLDIIYYSKFLHHLSDSDKENFKNLLTKMAKHIIEFDDYRGLYLPIMSLLTNWRSPILLNGAVFSALRVPDRTMLLKDKDNMGWATKVFPLKGYIKTYQDSSFTDE